jgi:SAM-dependent methyltransferase
VGSGEGQQADLVFPDAKIERLDIDPDKKPDIVHDIRDPFPEEMRGKYDGVYCSHLLEHIPRTQVIPTVGNLASLLKNGGELWAIVPALEWAAKQIARDTPSPALVAFLYGSQDNDWMYHRCGFTLMMLRQVMEINGLITRQAYQAPLTIAIGERKYECLQNVVVGLKYVQ